VHLALGKATYESMVLVICAINAVAVSVAVQLARSVRKAFNGGAGGARPTTHGFLKRSKNHSSTLCNCYQPSRFLITEI